MTLFWLRELITVLVASIVVSVIFHRIKIPTVVGFLITGIIIGPGGLALIRNIEAIKVLAEVGVMMLLFTIGIEFSLERLQKIKRYFWLAGGSQVLLTIIVVIFISGIAGTVIQEAIFYSFLIALSSTAVVLKILGDKNQINSPVGQVSMGILIFQDIAIVPMLAFIPLLANLNSVSWLNLAERFVVSLAAVVAVFFAARKVMPHIIAAIIRTRVKEIFLFSALFACLGLAYFTASLKLSLALGAFLAGIIISESYYSHQVVADILPFKDVFNSLFFVSVGMLLDIRMAWKWKGLIALVVGCILMVKIIIVFLILRLLKLTRRVSWLAALGLAQVGEFSFVLATVGRQYGFLEGQAFDIFVSSSVLTILATPFFIGIGPKLADRLFRRWEVAKKPEAANLQAAELHDHVIIAGFGLNGQNLARVLKETGVPFIILELNPDTFRQVSRSGEPALFGDVSSPTILKEAGIARAKALVLAISDPAATRRAVSLARSLNHDIFIIVRTRFISEIDELYSLGANDVIPEEFETSVEIFVRVLEKYRLPRNIINTQVQVIRAERYGLLRASRSSSRRLTEKIYDFLEAGVVETFLLTSDSWLNGKTLGEIDLRGKTGVTVIAVVRDEISHSTPGADFKLQGKDVLVLVGDHQAMDHAFDYLSHGADRSMEERLRKSLIQGA